MKVLFAASEAYPYAMSGGLADVAGALPKALRRRMVGCRVILPLYSSVKEELRAEMRFLGSVTVPVAWRWQYCGVFEARTDRVIYYLLDNQYYFKRDGLYGHYDDAERFAFFSRAVLEVLPLLDFAPDVIHCNDWQTALIPVYLDLFYRHDPRYSAIRTVFTIHNIQYQGKYGNELIGDVLGLSDAQADLVSYDGCVNLMKGGIQCADRVTTVSPTYAAEILNPGDSFGLDRILRPLSGKLCGIVNGIDTEVYNPADDPAIFAPFSADDLSGKAENKVRLQELLGLPQRDVPLVGMVTRLVSQKGLDLVRHVFDELMQLDLQIAILGSGQWEFETFFHEAAQRYADRVALRLGFLPELAHRIYAGADLFLMPSRNEPCGLAQMVALRYGTIPIVRRTGGLNDTISDSGDGKGNGFTFDAYNAHDMLHAVRRAVGGYADREGWQILVKRAMACDNSWARSAGAYIRLYQSLRG